MSLFDITPVNASTATRGIDTPCHPVGVLPAARRTILIVEPNDTVRDAAVRALRRSRYQVLAAARAGDALTILDSHRGPVDLLIADVRLPDMTGGELAARMCDQRRELRALFITGPSGEEKVSGPRTRTADRDHWTRILLGKVRDILVGQAWPEVA